MKEEYKTFIIKKRRKFSYFGVSFVLKYNPFYCKDNSFFIFYCLGIIKHIIYVSIILNTVQHFVVFKKKILVNQRIYQRSKTYKVYGTFDVTQSN